MSRVKSSGAGRGRASFDIPRLPAKADLADMAAMAKALGLSSGDLGLGELTAARWSAGNPFSFVPVRSLDAMRRCVVDLSIFDGAFAGGGRAAAFLFCRETQDAGNDFHSRMFAPAFGMLEDPATGSAVAAFAGYLAATGDYKDGTHVVRIEQGYEMGRASLLELTINVSAGKLTGASIAGDAVVGMEGTIDT